MRAFYTKLIKPHINQKMSILTGSLLGTVSGAYELHTHRFSTTVSSKEPDDGALHTSLNSSDDGMYSQVLFQNIVAPSCVGAFSGWLIAPQVMVYLAPLMFLCVAADFYAFESKRSRALEDDLD
jgi:hypothetical protein